MEPNELEKTWPRVYSILGIDGIARLCGCDIKLRKKSHAEGYELEFSRFPSDNCTINNIPERSLLNKLEKFNFRGICAPAQFGCAHPKYPNASRYFKFFVTPYPHHVYVKLQPWDCDTRALWYSKDTKDGTARIFDAIEEYTRAWYWRDVEFARLLPQPIAEEILEHI